MTDIRTVGVVGGGLIGLSWASLFAAKGCRVIIVDPDPRTEDRLHAFLPEALSNLESLGIAGRASISSPIVTDQLSMLSAVQFVQENGPERLEAKRAIMADIEANIAPDVVIASSTSSLRASDMQEGALHPSRILVAHPMNPPHLIPMVELVAGRSTSADALDTAEQFYDQMQRVTIRVKSEVAGHLANRLTSALYREAVHLVAEGIAEVEDVDKAIAYGPGMRWALMGPHLTYHLGGGAAGYRGYLDHLGPTQEARWKSLGNPALTAATKAALVEGLERSLEGQDEATLIARRDAALVDLLKMKKLYDL